MAGGKEGKEGRQAIFFTPLDPYHNDANEAETVTYLSKPPEEDAVYWINLSRS